MQQLNADLRAATEKCEEEEKQAAYYRDLYERSQSNKKEMQRLRSSLGEAESKIERLEKEKEGLKR